MRLLNTETLDFEEFPDERNVRYAILSHRWEEEEASFQLMRVKNGIRKANHQMKGFRKIRRFCELARDTGFKYAWVDTCCIDKRSSAELQEAINSMFRWYGCSSICYVYLSDVNPKSTTANGRSIPEWPQFEASEWWKRGWTLQELVAPKTVIFLDSRWDPIGNRNSLCAQILSITEIPGDILENGLYDKVQSQRKWKSSTYTVAQVMAWASGRETTRIEDRAYSLMGLFGIQMPMLYGEGEQAFRRLQEEIFRRSNDQSIFFWDMGDQGIVDSPFAPDPSSFVGARDERFADLYRRSNSFVTAHGVTMQVFLIPWACNVYLALLNYTYPYRTLEGWSGRWESGIFLSPLASDADDRFLRVKYQGQSLWYGRRSDVGPKSLIPYLRSVTLISNISFQDLLGNRNSGRVDGTKVQPEILVTLGSGFTPDLRKRIIVSDGFHEAYQNCPTRSNEAIKMKGLKRGEIGQVLHFEFRKRRVASGRLRTIAVGYNDDCKTFVAVSNQLDETHVDSLEKYIEPKSVYVDDLSGESFGTAEVDVPNQDTKYSQRGIYTRTEAKIPRKGDTKHGPQSWSINIRCEDTQRHLTVSSHYGQARKVILGVEDSAVQPIYIDIDIIEI